MNMVFWIILIMAVLIVWIIIRYRKYPLHSDLPPLQLFIIPGFFLTNPIIKMGNFILRKTPLPSVDPSLIRHQILISTDKDMPLKLTVYIPKNVPGPLPCLIYYHGGGFCFEDAPYIHKNVMEYAKNASCQIVFVHYRTSDTAPFPAPFQDACSAIKYVWSHAEELNVDKDNIALGGDSAGGALAASCCQWVKECTEIKLRFQMLIYPVTDNRMQTNSMRYGKDTPCWNALLNRQMWQFYLRAGIKENSNWAVPILSTDLSDLPNAYIEVEQFDCLHDEGIEYANRLKNAGVCVHLEEVKGTFHGFDLFHKAKVVQTMLICRSHALRDAWIKKA